MINIYEVIPCKMLDDNSEFENNVYSIYLSCIKLLDFDYQIIINTKSMDFSDMLLMFDKTIYETDNFKQKEMIQNYRTYLNDISKEIEIYNSKFYLVVNKLDVNKERLLKEGFKNMKSIGITIEKVVGKDVLIRLLYESLNGGGKVEIR